jgi:hypothetical protein
LAKSSESEVPPPVKEASSLLSLPPADLWSCFDEKHYSPADRQVLLCPAWSPGYNLTEKEWGLFNVDKLVDIPWKQNPIEQLQIDKNQKEIVSDFVRDHFSHRGNKEVIGEKGMGSIILLHGNPGCGKTLTAGE